MQTKKTSLPKSKEYPFPFKYFIQIDSTPLGRTLFDTIAIQLEAGDPLETLIGTLHELEDRYIAE